ncbi:methylenetetrahydrofolate reductase [Candidatus Deianiraea vastatrix]|uniref:Methylenetetrahydrofolate reductase n=1 Tax=Candidatus Deianiraea vastatrix TaxID=2163644 RepID=A0A5B8XE06_9RICK|nr:methylenetetrahydrofolate reductase [Candidatus Deianiraea vastatrix]QED23493.1 5,10-methylenetetrahydrofolate reductase [Candidatus Deianiraea vastatrix]
MSFESKLISSSSFEFFPPLSESGFSALESKIVTCLSLKSAKFASITYGASSSGQERTIAFVNYFAQKYPALMRKIALHITCTEKTKIEVLQNIKHFYNFGIRQFVIIRGDGNILTNGFQYASELIAAARKEFFDIAIYIAGYPEKDNELQYTKMKIEYGVNACITQVCFDAEKLIDFAKKIKIPIIPGLILPSEKSINFAKKLGVFTCEIPDPKAFLKDQITHLQEGGFSHFHFYTLNNFDDLLFLFYENI